MKIPFTAIVVISLALLGAHFLRYGNELGVAASLAFIALLFVRRPWAARVVQAGLLLGVIEWAYTLYELVQLRMAMGAPVARMTAIIGAVIAVTLVSALLFQTMTMQRMYGLRTGRPRTDGEGNGSDADRRQPSDFG